MSAQALYEQGKQLYDAGSLHEAMAAFQRARAEFLTAGELAQAATVGNDLGVVYYLSGRGAEASQVLEDTLAQFERLGDARGQAKAAGNLAQVLNHAHATEQAERYYKRAADLFHQLDDRMLEYDTHRALSHMLLMTGRFLESLAAYDRALAAKGGAGFLRAIIQIPLRIMGVR
ncbi:MAG: tetratricopeptide repeat protein [Chloroflexi bacterium]|nr:tetratricopeptide repeat protein [Chloroflexota bacterium]